MSMVERMQNDPVVVEVGPPSDKLELLIDQVDDDPIVEAVAPGDTLEP